MIVDPETVDVELLRTHVSNYEKALHTDPSRDRVRQTAANIATTVAGEHTALVAKARALPPAQSLVPLRGISSPIARDEIFDAAVNAFIAECYATIDAVEDFQQRLKANAGLHDDEVVSAVLTEAAKTAQPQWSSNLFWPLGIPQLRVQDALEELARDGAIDVNTRSETGLGTYLFSVTAHGRRRARGTAKQPGPLTAIQLTQHINNSTIASAGFAFDTVEQTVTINPDVRDIIEALSDFREAAGNDAAAAIAVTLAEGAARELHANGWGEKAARLLGAIPGALGGMTALVANVKPAYELIRNLAAAHGVDLQPLP